MGFSVAMFAATILLSPLLLVVAAIIFVVGKWLRLFQPGVPAFVNIMLCCCLTLGLLLLYGSAEELVIRPRQFQQQYLGAIFGTPLNLRRHEHQPHIMDPASEWHYSLDASTAAILRRRCRSNYERVDERGCTLASHHDDRWLLAISLSENDQLHIEDVLW